MEALVILLGEFLFAPFLAALSIVLELIVSILSLLFQIVYRAISKKLTEREKDTDGSPPSSRKTSRALSISQRVRNLSLILFCGSLIGFSLLQFAFFEASVRWITSTAENRTGIKTNFREVSGNLFLGKFHFKDLHIQRENNPESNFDFTIENALIDLDMFMVFGGKSNLQELRAEDIRGYYTRHATPKKHKKVRRPFVIQQLLIQRAELDVTLPSRNGEATKLPLSLTSLTISPLRSDNIAFDSLFRTNLSASLADGELIFTSEQISDGRKTAWIAKQISLQKIATLLPAPLAWADGGTFSAIVTDRWQLGKVLDIDMHWDVEVREPKVLLPEGLSVGKRAVSLPIAALLNRTQRIPVSFSLKINRDVFEVISSFVELA